MSAPARVMMHVTTMHMTTRATTHVMARATTPTPARA